MADYLLDPLVCGIKGCDGPSAALGLCVNHWRRNRLYGSPLARKKHSGMFQGLSPAERFGLQVKKGEGCWEWQGSRDKGGYGIFRGVFDGVKYNKAHRYSYAAHTGEQPGDLHVLHECDNPRCVNPAHLFLGTNATNMADKIAKGRARVAKGPDNGSAKLTAKQAARILKDPRTYLEIGNEYGIAASTVGSIKSGQSWGHLGVKAVKGRNRGDARRGVSDKLTEKDIREIRASPETGKVLASRFNVSRQSICDIQKRRSWKHVI